MLYLRQIVDIRGQPEAKQNFWPKIIIFFSE